MKFEEKINLLINENEVPDCISPQNIAIMLKQKTAEKNNKPSVPAISMKSKQQAIRFRSSAAVAACVALVGGVMAFVNDNGTALPISYFTSVAEVKEAEDYSDVYKVIQDAFIKSGSLIQGLPDSKNIPKVTTPAVTEPKPAPTPAQPEETSMQYDVLYNAGSGVTKADILKTDGTNLYYVANNSLYIVSVNGGKMTLVSKISAANTVPVEMYIDQNKLIVLSNHSVEMPYEVKPSETSKAAETTAGSQTSGSSAAGSETTKPADSSVTTAPSTSAETTAAPTATTVPSKTGTDTSGADPKIPSTIKQSSVIVDVYDITDKAAPKIAATYKQNGTYISSSMNGSALYLVTNYAGYQTKPLASQQDLGNYVPAYWLGETKTYIDAKDIILPPSISSTSYTVVSGLNVQSPTLLTSIKAVLGNVKESYASASALYVVGSGPAIGDKDSSNVTKFALSEGGVTYSANATVEGTLLNEYSMGEQGTSFRLATVTSDAKTLKKSANLYILGADLKTTGSLTGLYADKALKTVRFEGDKAYLFAGEQADVVSLADPASLKLTDVTAGNEAAYLYSYTENRQIGLGREYDKDGKLLGLKLTMFDSSAGALKELHSISLNGYVAPALADTVINSNALILDAAGNRIGIPTESQGEYGYKNLYYALSYDEANGFVQTGLLEYTDIDNTFAFNRAVSVGDVFYALSGGRIVSAQLADLKVIETLSLK